MNVLVKLFPLLPLIFGAIVYVAIDLVARLRDAHDARRVRDAATPGHAFSVVSPAALKYDGEGPGRYQIRGVHGATGRHTTLLIDATSSDRAILAADLRGVVAVEVKRQ